MNILVNDAIKEITKKLLDIYPEYTVAQAHAWYLLESVTGLNKGELLASKIVSIDAQALETMLDSISTGKPIQYILGTIPFLDLTIKVRPPVLIPRVETEWWCSILLENLTSKNNAKGPKAFSVLDVCTGSGCVALAIASSYKQSSVVAIDNAEYALNLARENAAINNVQKVSFVLSDLYDALEKDVHFDLIVANPPYISSAEYSELDPSVKNWEAQEALIADDNGYAILQKIIYGAPLFLSTESGCGELWCEIGYNQAARVAQFFSKAGFRDITILRDQYGKDRVVKGIIKANV